MPGIITAQRPVRRGVHSARSGICPGDGVPEDREDQAVPDLVGFERLLVTGGELRGVHGFAHPQLFIALCQPRENRGASLPAPSRRRL